MSEVFEVGAFFDGSILKQGSGCELSRSEAMQVCSNHNNHDRLVEEIEQLKKDEEELREALGLIVYADEIIKEGLNVHGGMSMMVGSIENARDLLSKTNQLAK